MMVAVRGATDLGLKRSQNEDSHASWIPDDDHQRDQRGILLVVADGMGGTRAGEVASRLAADTVVAAYRSAPGQDVLEDLHAAVEAANREVHRESRSDPDLSGMGTTCTAVVLRGREMYFAHVGDSRAYLFRDGQVQQITTDHSLVAQLVQRKQLTPEEARVDPRRNVVTRSVGVGPEVDIDARRWEGELRDGDTILICSDGLHGQVTDAELAEFAESEDLDEACRGLIELANERGGPDNITVMMARVADENSTGAVRRPAAGGGPAPADRRRMLTWLILAMLVLLAVLVALIVIVGRLGRETEALERAACVPQPRGVAWL